MDTVLKRTHFWVIERDQKAQSFPEGYITHNMPSVDASGSDSPSTHALRLKPQTRHQDSRFLFVLFQNCWITLSCVLTRLMSPREARVFVSVRTKCPLHLEGCWIIQYNCTREQIANARGSTDCWRGLMSVWGADLLWNYIMLMYLSVWRFLTCVCWGWVYAGGSSVGFMMAGCVLVVGGTDLWPGPCGTCKHKNIHVMQDMLMAIYQFDSM